MPEGRERERKGETHAQRERGTEIQGGRGDYGASVRERISGYVLQYFSLAGVII